MGNPITRTISMTYAERVHKAYVADIIKLPSIPINGEYCKYNAYLELDVLRLPKKPPSKIALAKARREEALVKALKEASLELREDSYLCSQYIAGRLEKDWTVSKIVRRMGEMKYLHEEMDYKKFLQMGRKEKDADSDDESRVSEWAERLALLTLLGGAYPEVFPWEEKKKTHVF
jgi:hypothetical protein